MCPLPRFGLSGVFLWDLQLLVVLPPDFGDRVLVPGSSREPPRSLQGLRGGRRTGLQSVRAEDSGRSLLSPDSPFRWGLGCEGSRHRCLRSDLRTGLRSHPRHRSDLSPTGLRGRGCRRGWRVVGLGHDPDPSQLVGVLHGSQEPWGNDVGGLLERFPVGSCGHLSGDPGLGRRGPWERPRRDGGDLGGRGTDTVLGVLLRHLLLLGGPRDPEGGGVRPQVGRRRRQSPWCVGDP